MELGITVMIMYDCDIRDVTRPDYTSRNGAWKPSVMVDIFAGGAHECQQHKYNLKLNEWMNEQNENVFI